MATKLSGGSKKAANSKLALDRPKSVPAGVIGLGLMGRSIIACLLAAGHRVVGVTQSLLRRHDSRRRILAHLRDMKRERLFSGDPRAAVEKLQLSEDFSALSGCGFVVESVLEDLPVKHAVIRKVEAVVSPEALIGSNTSALPITEAQRGAQHPERIMGIHWGNPLTSTCLWKSSAEIKPTPSARSASSGWRGTGRRSPPSCGATCGASYATGSFTPCCGKPST